MFNAHRDYREILKDEYESRLNKNPRYSLRAFARDLGVAPSRVVEVLNYKRGLSRLLAARMAKSLELNKKETEIFLNLVDSVHGRSQLTRSQASLSLNQVRSQEYATLQLDAFKLIADWHHYAILELTLVADFQSEPGWIAKRLGIQKTITVGAIERLKRLGLLIEANGRLKATDAMTFSSNGIASEGLKKHHEQILEKATNSIYCQSLEQRDLSAMTMAIRSADIPMAKEQIKKFRRGLSAELEAAPRKDAVYCLAIQFFQLDEPKAAQTSKPRREIER
jgi:uncharacterized protein (TIGR02147 family)